MPHLRLVPLLLLTSALGCDASQDSDADGGCTTAGHCKLLGDEPTCEEGYEWEDPDDKANLTCVPEGDCQGESTAALCEDEGYECGTHQAEDRCGETRNLNCGGCSGGTCVNGQCTGGAACDGDCAGNTYTACTCGTADPCGWGDDGYCDADCAEVAATPFDDGDDCGDDVCTCSLGQVCDADGDCVSACATNNNGYCDEPEGTDTCPAFSDDADCQPCGLHERMTSTGRCQCNPGYVEDEEGDCAAQACGFDLACPGSADCTWSFAEDALACSDVEGELSLGTPCLDADNASAWDKCGPFQICHWSPCDTTTVCHRVCEIAADCAGYFGCGVGTCQLFPGSSYGYCK